MVQSGEFPSVARRDTTRPPLPPLARERRRPGVGPFRVSTGTSGPIRRFLSQGRPSTDVKGLHDVLSVSLLGKTEESVTTSLHFFRTLS